MRFLECLLWLVTLFSWVKSNSSGGSKNPGIVVVWEEEIPTQRTLPDEGSQKSIQRRVHTLWEGVSKSNLKLLRRLVRPTSSTEPAQSVPPPPSMEGPPHPLRTDEWELNVRWKNPNQRKKRSGTVVPPGPDGGGARWVGKSSLLQLEFAPNGYVRCHPSPPSSSSSSSEPEDSSSEHPPPYIGTWELTSTGLAWSIDMDGCLYMFRGDLHVNPFGSHPRLTRGIVLLQEDTTPSRRAGWFRPVVATFTGNGNGRDAADLSYESRNHRHRTIINRDE